MEFNVKVISNLKTTKKIEILKHFVWEEVTNNFHFLTTKNESETIYTSFAKGIVG